MWQPQGYEDVCRKNQWSRSLWKATTGKDDFWKRNAIVGYAD